MPKLISIGDQIPCTRIDAVHSRYKRTVNFEYQGSLISVHGFPDPKTPLSIHLVEIDPGSVWCIERTPESSLVINDHLCIDFDDEQLYHAAAYEYTHRQMRPYSIKISALQDLLRKTVHDNPLLLTLSGTKSCIGIFDQALEDEFDAAWNLWNRGQYRESALSFKGRGSGSSPAGDDFLSGLLLGLKTREYSEGADFTEAREAIFEAAHTDNLLVDTLLNLAFRGWADSDFVAMVQSLINDSKDLDIAVQKILMHGSSSGADSLLGYVGAWSQIEEVICSFKPTLWTGNIWIPSN